ncbi:MAG: aspartate aminotransferase family protein, partial [Arenicellales bacterium]
PMAANQVGPMFGLFFTDNPEVCSFDDVSACDGKKFNQFFHGMLEQGIYLAPSAFEAGFTSAAHDQEDIAATIDAAAKVFSTLG